MNKMSQNIFDYATSELSQDAFICLLVSWFDSDDIELKRLSINFISFLYEKYYPNKKLGEIKTVSLYRQYKKIDVYFIITLMDDSKISFIIEDKTWTEPHSNQLEKYVKVVSKNYKKEDIVKIFFKTGHITEKDRCETKTEGFNYYILEVRQIYNFLQKNTISSYIYNQYKEFIKKEFYDKLYVGDKKIPLKNRTYNELKNGYVQYEILEKIKYNIIGSVDCNNLKPYIKHIRNGKSWETQWTYLNLDYDYIFFKISKRENNYCVRLVQYSKNKLEDRQNRKERLHYYQKIVKKINLLNFQIGTSKKNARESDIALVFFDKNDDNTILNVIEKFTNFAVEFRQDITLSQ